MNENNKMYINMTINSIIDSVKDASNTQEETMMMIDSGANINIITYNLFQLLKNKYNYKHTIYEIHKKIGTATQNAVLTSIGRIYIGGIIGSAEICNAANKNLISVMQMNKHGAKVDFTPAPSLQCIITMPKSNSIICTLNNKYNLYFIDINDLIVIEYNVNSTSNKNNRSDVLISASTTEKPNIVMIGNYNKIKTSIERRHQVFLLHKKFGHRNFITLANAIKNGIVLNSGMTYELILIYCKYIDCTACALSKWTENINKEPSGQYFDIPLHTLSADAQGPFRGAIGGFVYTIIATGKKIGFVTKTINADEWIKCFDKVCKYATRYNFKVRRLRCDRGTVENSDIFAEYLSAHERAIELIPAAAEAQYLNPVERTVRTWKEAVACMMIDQQVLPDSFWPFAYLMYMDIDGKLPNIKCVDSTPDFIIMKVVTDLSKCCKFYFGQEVVTRKTGGKQPFPNTRNEYAIVIGAGNHRTGSMLVYLPQK
jgi:hypothetical protein